MLEVSSRQLYLFLLAVASSEEIPDDSSKRRRADPDLKPWPRAVAITDVIQKAEQILEQIDERWPTTDAATVAEEKA